MDISEWRKKIDSIDSRMIELLSERTQAAVQIGALKRSLGLPILDSKREAEVLQKIVQQNPGPLSSESLEAIFRSIMEQTRVTESTHTEAR